MFEQNKSFEVSKKFFELLENKLKNLNPSFKGYYNVFNNHREQVLQLITYADNEVEEDLCIWSCMCRNSDEIMVVIADRKCSDNNSMFDDKALKSAKYFNRNDYSSATDYALNVIKKNFPRHLNRNYNYKFTCNKSLSDLERIINDAENLDYEDYRELATFEENDMFCDLVIMQGTVGLRYSKYLDEEHTGFEHLYFKRYEPDLTSEVTLILGMKQKLNDFIDDEIEYDVQIGI